MSDAMLHAQLTQAKAMAAKLAQERETYIRLCALLVRAIVEKAQVKVLDGNLAFTAEEFKDVPKKWTVGVSSALVKDESDPTDDGEQVLVVEVKPKINTDAPRLIVANGRV